MCTLNSCMIMYMRPAVIHVPPTGVPPGGPYLQSTAFLITDGYTSDLEASEGMCTFGIGAAPCLTGLLLGSNCTLRFVA